MNSQNHDSLREALRIAIDTLRFIRVSDEIPANIDSVICQGETALDEHPYRSKRADNARSLTEFWRRGEVSND